MKTTKELMELAKSAKSMEELKKLAQENEIEISEQDVEMIYSRFHKTGELEDDELENVSAGCYESGDTPVYAVNDHVRFCVGKGWVTGTIQKVSSKKSSVYGIYKEFRYDILIDHSTDVREDVYESDISGRD